MENYMRLEISAQGVNESFARSAVAAFALPLNLTIEEASDVKTAVSEAVTNCIVHAYRGLNLPFEERKIVIEAKTFFRDGKGILHIVISDNGKGIEDVNLAISPFYTTLEEEERSGMGFTVMQAFMSDMQVESKPGEGTRVTLIKTIESDGE